MTTRSKTANTVPALPGDFHEATRRWFASTLGTPTRAQALGWEPIVHGQSTLLLAPTGSGKTLAAFLAAVDAMMFAPVPEKMKRCRLVYVSPLKALAVDIERNLRAPIAGIQHAAASLGVPAHVPVVEIRTGDTPQKDRARMMRTPPDILITTPESLFLILTSKAASMIASAQTLIVDEIHSLVSSKRGAHLFVTVERLEALRERHRATSPLQRIGLSATQRPLDEVARLLGGLHAGKPRDVTVVDAGHTKKLDLRVDVGPLLATSRAHAQGDADERESDLEDDFSWSGNASGAAKPRSVWPALQEHVLALVEQHRSTMMFVNSRRMAERLANALNDMREGRHCDGPQGSAAASALALAHHGSLSREQRTEIEDLLKRGKLPAIVATSSLELGIDIGAVDLVIQVEAPPSVAAGLQRVGRASHQVGGVPRGVFVPKHRADVLACTAVVAEMHAGHVEETLYPRNPLDVLAQQLVAIATEGAMTVTRLYDLIRQAAPFADLPRASFESVLDMLSGRYPSHEFAELRPRLVWDRVRDEIIARPEAKRLVVTNAGTIPDRGLYGVFLAGQGPEHEGARRVGELDEEMVFELREGEVFLLGAASWRVEQITLNRVYVTPAPGEPSKMPFWHGDKSGRPQALGEQIGKLIRQVSNHLDKSAIGESGEGNDRVGSSSMATDAESSAARAWLTKHYPIDDAAAGCIVSYVRDQWTFSGAVPTDKNVVVERFVDEVGDWRVVLLSPFGISVHAPWAMAIMHGLRERYAGEIEMHYTDDGIAFRIPACDEPPASLFFPSPDRVEELAVAAVATTSLFAARFRESAGRALLLPKRDPRSRAPLWAQRKRAGDLYLVASKYPSFPLILETYRECLKDVFHLPGLVDLLRRVQSRAIRYETVDTPSPSPFASNVLFAFVGNFMYEGDVPLAERRVQALRVDHAQLRELLGETDMRALLDVDAVTEYEQWLQWLGRKARSADELHDMLRGIGECTFDEICARVREPEQAETWLHELERQRRVWPLRLGGVSMWAVVEDAALYRDALGVPLVTGLPTVFLQTQTSPMVQLVARYARSRGPFVGSALQARWACSEQAVQDALRELVRSGDVVEGAFFSVAPPNGEREYCHAEVLRVLRQRSLSRAQRGVQPVPIDAYARFLVDWQGLQRKRSGIDGLLMVIQQLQGCPIPFSVLESEVLPARVSGYRAWDLDALCASGDVVWRGCESIGSDDGRIALYLADDEPVLHEARGISETHHAGELHEQIRDVLRSRGASFFGDITQELHVYRPEVLEALWDLVWAGEVANDTLRPLRSRLQSSHSTASGTHARSHTMRGRRLLGHGVSSVAQSQGGRVTGRTVHRVLPGSEGRWSLCSHKGTQSVIDNAAGMRADRADRDGRQTERQLARALALLERYGVVTKSAAHAEGIAGGFSSVYDVFRSLEASGRVRRGYYIEGLGGLQFALPGADERLRQERDAALSPQPDTQVGARSTAVMGPDTSHPTESTREFEHEVWVLAATDPANPYGALVEWPAWTSPSGEASTLGRSPRPQRSAGATVVLFQGRLLAWLNRRKSDVLTFLQHEEPLHSEQARALVGGLAKLVDDGQRKGVLVERIDGRDAVEHPLAEHFLREGFRPSGRGLRKVSTRNAERYARG
jgi:ATP-dependent Lhr-like helicase